MRATVTVAFRDIPNLDSDTYFLGTFDDAALEQAVQSTSAEYRALLRGFGFRGVPGFIVVNADGAPRLRHEGPLDDRVVGTRILPALRAA